MKQRMEAWKEELYRDELYHHGVLGMKWGVRRYQNPDGTLTAAGRRRYDVAKAKSDSDREKHIKKYKKIDTRADRNIRRIKKDDERVQQEYKNAEETSREKFGEGSRKYIKEKAFQDAMRSFNDKAVKLAKMNEEAKKHKEIRETAEYRSAKKEFSKAFTNYMLTGAGSFRYQQLVGSGSSKATAAARVTVENILGTGVNWPAIYNMYKFDRRASGY